MMTSEDNWESPSQSKCPGAVTSQIQAESGWRLQGREGLGAQDGPPLGACLPVRSDAGSILGLDSSCPHRVAKSSD